jgi:hypothetical protein
MNILVFLTGIAISAVAAYYSIIGLTTIFAGAFWAVVIMGSVLEVGKLVAVSWLYNNWRDVPFLIKSYLMAAILVLMLITSMGIFGFLSKAHIEQNLAMNTGVTEQIEIINNDIKSVEGSIADLNKQVAQIDAAIEKMTEKNRAENSLKAAEQQRKTRGDLIKRKNDEIKKLSELKTQKIKYESEFKKVEAEIGPIKYVAELFYGGSERDIVDKAIRSVIILLIFVFDPLAILLLLAFNISNKRDDVPEFLDLSEVKDVERDEPRKSRKTVGNMGSNRRRKRLQDKEANDSTLPIN